ncbi:pre-rRNA-processing protein ESF1 [Argentina anserina]|uniref:pre-rRNA-processing protein ESF1 n=1 Tax=Argentina anserina TaxID=57926 RepID=UPI0021763547|nr:pre-rRNA-processing protein ESF1 [Potentilla anserina]
MGSKKNKKNKNRDNNLITDPRFASVHWDPRFKNAPKHKAKVEIDDRFKVMFTDPRFRSSSAPSDKRGKLKKKTDPGDELRHYYQPNEDEDEVKYDKVDEDEEEEDELSEESESEREEKARSKEESESEAESEEEKARVAVEESESEEMEAGNESETTTDMDTDEDEEDEVVFEDGMPAMQNENIPQIEKETHRLAVVDLDWTHVKAVDLFVVLRSFLPKGGEIKSVAVYPSDFGIERMKQEEIHGPVLLDDTDKKADEESDDDDEDVELINQKWRAYEKSRLRYYYAVVECDSVATADYLYRNCDGVEFERSSNILDLRFIPDSLEIKHPPRDTATEVPSNYVGLDFQTRALQQSNIEPSWDDDEPNRRILKRKFSQVDELEMDEFITSDESETGEDEAEDDVDDKANKKSKKRARYISLLQSGDGDGSGEDDEEDGQDMEVTFNTSLEDFNKRMLEKKDRKSETVWEASLRKRREKKKMKRNRSNYSSEDETSDSDQEAKEEPDDFFIEEPSVKRSKKESRGKSNKEEKQRLDMDEEAASRHELELLLADDKGVDKGAKGYNLKRKKTKGKKKGKEDPEENKIPTADLDDPRFAPLLTSSLFALDPTNPQFKRSATYERQAALRQHQGDREEVPKREVKVQSEGLSSKIKKSSLINSIKMKAKPFEKKEEILPFPGRKETKGEQDSATGVKPVKKKAKVGRK